jgi:AraC-like DNA-binding protein
MAVTSELKQLKIQYLKVDLGSVTLENDLLPENKEQLVLHLEALGFELLDDENTQTIQQIKTVLIELVYQKNNDIDVSLSHYLVQHLNQDYSKLSNLFSQIEGISIEKYLINLKIEKVKELLVYDELSLSEIANLLNYSSVSHLSHQFKKVTGFSPSYFKKLKENKRTELDQL